MSPATLARYPRSVRPVLLPSSRPHVLMACSKKAYASVASPDIAIAVAGRGSGMIFGQTSQDSPPLMRESEAITSS